MIAEYKSTAGAVADIVGGRLAAGGRETIIERIVSDSRELSGRGCLFVPIRGEKFDGHDYIEKAFEGGAVSAALSMTEGYEQAAARNGAALINCGDTLAALGLVAAAHRLEMKAVVAGVTGTNGKTTVKEMLHHILSPKYSCFKNEKNYNNEIGVPFTILGLRPSHEKAVIEMGMNHPGEIERLSKIARPDVAVITGVGEGHLEYLGSVRNVALAKSEIFMGMRPDSLAVVNADNEFFNLLEERACEYGVKVTGFGLERGDIVPDSYQISPEGIRFKLFGVEMHVPVYGLHNVSNAVAAAAAASYMGVSPEETASALSSFKGVSGRSELVECGGVTVINDSYNSNPLSASSAIKSASAAFRGRRLIAVLGDMKELGPEAARLHAGTGREAALNGFAALFVCGEFSREYASGAAGAGMDSVNAIEFDSREELARYLKSFVLPGDVVLVKGSRSTKMEEVVQALVKREER